MSKTMTEDARQYFESLAARAAERDQKRTAQEKPAQTPQAPRAA